MRVVFLTHNYPRDSGDLAGAFLHPLALALRDRGHDVRVVAPSDAGQGGRGALDGVPVTRVRYASPGRERYAYTGRMQEAVTSPAGLLALRALHAALRRATRAEAAGADGAVVVHAHWWLPGGLAAPPELPLVVTLHGTDARLIARHRLTALVARRVLRPPRVVTAVSRAVAELAAGALTRPIDAGHVCPMPVTEAPRRSRGGKGIVFVGRLTEQKRLTLALEALGRLPEVVLTIVGEGPARPGLEAAARTAGLSDRVRFVGRVAPNQVAELSRGRRRLRVSGRGRRVRSGGDRGAPRRGAGSGLSGWGRGPGRPRGGRGRGGGRSLAGGARRSDRVTDRQSGGPGSRLMRPA